MATIRKIKPPLPETVERKRVAAYARVSSESDNLLHSLSAQISYYSDLIQNNPEWVYAGVFADSGITGTSVTHRDEFKRLMAECDAGNIDIILVKSISRFARNTVDTLEAVRHLKDIGVEVRFERERISSMSGDGELMLTILASYAQEESESISRNIRWAVRKSYEKGIPHSTPKILGYSWVGKDLVIEPDEARAVRFIFEKYIEGYSTVQIPKLLKAGGMVGVHGEPMTRASVKDVLSNEIYTGTLILQKNFAPKIRQKKRNHGEMPMYRVDDNHEPIISREMFEEAERQRVLRGENAPNRNKEITPFSGKVVCGKCGYKCSRRTAHGYKVWRCNNRETNGACDGKQIYETLLGKAVKDAVGDSGFQKIILYDDRVDVISETGKKLSWERSWRDEYHKFRPSVYKGYIFCGYCGSTMRKTTTKKSQNGVSRYYKNWKCADRINRAGCRCKAISMGKLDKATQSVLGLDSIDSIEEVFRDKVDKVFVFDDRVDFYLKDKEVVTWKRK